MTKTAWNSSSMSMECSDFTKSAKSFANLSNKLNLNLIFEMSFFGLARILTIRK